MNIPIKKNTTFAKVAKKLQKESEERPNDPISKRGLEDSMLKLEIAQEMVRKKKNKDKDNLVNVYGDGAELTTKEKNLSKLRYAPAIGSGLAVLSDAFGITNTPDYYNADLIGRAVDNIKDISYTPIGSYLRYTPMDRDYYTNKLRSMAAANRRAILNASPSRGAAIAGLLASDYNTMSKLGDLAIQADNYNQTLREKVATYNRATDAMNSEMALKAAMANTAQDKLRLYGRSMQADLRDQVDNLTSQAKSANLTNFYDNLGSIGKEQTSRNMIKTSPYSIFWVDSEGIMHYKGDFRETPNETPTKSLGGYLTVKNKRKKHGK